MMNKQHGIGESVTLDDPGFIHETARLQGKVYVGPEVSIWTYAVTRCEQFEIHIGARSNLQDFVMIHEGVSSGTRIGEDCSITHHVTLHGCDIGDGCLIGINAVVMDGVKIGRGSIVAGQAIVRENQVFPAYSVIAGVPAKLIATRDHYAANVANARYYQKLSAVYLNGQDRLEDA
jgi:carbonic anhydrase/acetyltransferase-like protein (isoleucine patch superfamily)|tara:strand:+ start:3387 stop:3914 length:528 start_codon:yes stop_codon:yes gene_type:complete